SFFFFFNSFGSSILGTAYLRLLNTTLPCILLYLLALCWSSSSTLSLLLNIISFTSFT
ncbi:hypothetical protein BDV10DRAFT_161049, partial [Aspergillus recurvatus]